MDLYFKTSDRGGIFTMEVGYFDTIAEIKEKIQKQIGIPIASQTLFFRNEILADELNVHYSNIVNESWIGVKVNPPRERKRETEVPVTVVNTSPIENQSPETQIFVRILGSPIPRKLRVDINQTVSQLKFQITLRFPTFFITPASQLVLKLENEATELDNARTLRQCQISTNSTVTVHLRSRKKLDFDSVDES